MAITTLDGLLAGMQYPREFIKAVTPTLVVGRPHSLFYLAGVPGAAAAPTPGHRSDAAPHAGAGRCGEAPRPLLRQGHHAALQSCPI